MATDSLGRKSLWRYDANGNVSSRTDAKNQTVQCDSDAANRLQRVTYPDGSVAQYAYAPDGRIQDLTAPSGSTHWRYDARGRLLQTTDGQNLSVGYEYDRRGHRTVVKYPGGLVARYEYDALNRLTHVTDWAGRFFSMAYNAEDTLSVLRYPNGVEARYDYDLSGRMTNFIYRKNNEVLLHHAIARDGRGLKVKEIVLEGFAPAFHPLDQSQSFDAADQLNRLGFGVVEHDRNGNLINSTPGETLSFDFENRLLSLQSQILDQQFVYNGLGDRVGRVVDGVVFHDLLDYGAPLKNVLVECDAQNQPLRRFLWGPGLLELVLADGSVRYAHADDMGNILALTDETGQITDEYTYDLYGQVQVRTPPGCIPTPNPYLFNGAYGVWHEGEGLYHMKARYYSAGLKRFLTPDPSGLKGGHNLYEFAESNPQSFRDPFGLCAETGSSYFSMGLERPASSWSLSSLFSKSSNNDILPSRSAAYEKDISPVPNNWLLNGVSKFIDLITLSSDAYAMGNAPSKNAAVKTEVDRLIAKTSPSLQKQAVNVLEKMGPLQDYHFKYSDMIPRKGNEELVLQTYKLLYSFYIQTAYRPRILDKSTGVAFGRDTTMARYYPESETIEMYKFGNNLSSLSHELLHHAIALTPRVLSQPNIYNPSVYETAEFFNKQGMNADKISSIPNEERAIQTFIERQMGMKENSRHDRMWEDFNFKRSYIDYDGRSYSREVDNTDIAPAIQLND